METDPFHEVDHSLRNAALQVSRLQGAPVRERELWQEIDMLLDIRNAIRDLL